MLAEQGLGLLGNAVLAKGKAVVEEKLGVKLDDTKPLSPEQTLELKKLEYEHEEWLMDADTRREAQDLEREKIELADTQNAREMQMTALKQDDLFAKRFVYYFATAIFALTAVYIAAITFATIPDKNLRFADTILGFLLGTLLATIINFFYGTSKSSQNKDATVSAMVSHITGGQK
jgi:hypothetical protein